MKPISDDLFYHLGSQLRILRESARSETRTWYKTPNTQLRQRAKSRRAPLEHGESALAASLVYGPQPREENIPTPLLVALDNAFDCCSALLDARKDACEENHRFAFFGLRSHGIRLRKLVDNHQLPPKVLSFYDAAALLAKSLHKTNAETILNQGLATYPRLA